MELDYWKHVIFQEKREEQLGKKQQAMSLEELSKNCLTVTSLFILLPKAKQYNCVYIGLRNKFYPCKWMSTKLSIRNLIQAKLMSQSTTLIFIRSLR